jgi:hypothetical protein
MEAKTKLGRDVIINYSKQEIIETNMVIKEKKNQLKYLQKDKGLWAGVRRTGKGRGQNREKIGERDNFYRRDE